MNFGDLRQDAINALGLRGWQRKRLIADGLKLGLIDEKDIPAELRPKKRGRR